MKMIRYTSVVLICLLLAAALLCSCDGNEQKTPPPAFADVKDELILRIENSKQVNEIFWGEGLPVIPIGSAEAEELGLYTEQNPIMTDDYGAWEYVDPSKTDIISVDAIKILAESAYSDSYLKGVYSAQFDGLYDSLNVNVLDPHYYEDEFWIWKNSNSEKEFRVIHSTREFDYSTMKIDESQSSGERIYVIVDSYIDGQSGAESKTLVFDKQEDGWYLSSPTY